MPETTTIDITPTWRAIVDILIEVVANGESLKARAEARKELHRMAEIADRAVAAAKEA
jgi:hypothetical protein